MPGLLRGMARTTAIVGTATAVSNGVSRRQYSRWNEQQQAQAAAEPQAAAATTPVPEAQPAQAATDPYDELEKLGRLKDQGLITQAEFDAKKQQLLGL